MTQEQLRGIVEQLRHIRRRPGMFIGSLTPERVHLYLHGFSMGCHAGGIKVVPSHGEGIVMRGWKGGTNSFDYLYKQIRARGLDERETAQELIDIEIAAWCATGKDLGLDVESIIAVEETSG